MKKEIIKLAASSFLIFAPFSTIHAAEKRSFSPSTDETKEEQQKKQRQTEKTIAEEFKFLLEVGTINFQDRDFKFQNNKIIVSTSDGNEEEWQYTESSAKSSWSFTQDLDTENKRISIHFRNEQQISFFLNKKSWTNTQRVEKKLLAANLVNGKIMNESTLMVLE
ncbi:MAG: hypothetical protein CMP11_07725 [Zetaproteobacteria bacterium]|nr:hypothetical protein [Pseudobdellovibrionaceae bacterium]